LIAQSRVTQKYKKRQTKAAVLSEELEALGAILLQALDFLVLSETAAAAWATTTLGVSAVVSDGAVTVSRGVSCITTA
jgi:hypothetical protein